MTPLCPTCKKKMPEGMVITPHTTGIRISWVIYYCKPCGRLWGRRPGKGVKTLRRLYVRVT